MQLPPESRRPCFCCYDHPFLVDNHRYKAGVYHHAMKEETDPDTQETMMVPVNIWICSVLKVLYIVRTEFCNENGYLLEYIPQGFANPRRLILRQSLLLGRPDEALKPLRDKGVSILRGHSAAVANIWIKNICGLVFIPRTISGPVSKSLAGRRSGNDSFCRIHHR